MPELIKHKDFHEFIKFNQKFINSNPFLYYNLNRTIKRVLKRQIQIKKFFNVVDGFHFSCCLMVDKECLLYANSVSYEMIPMFAEALELNKFNRYQFFGTKNIIDELFKQFNIKYSEQKYRKFYDCLKVASPFHYTDGEAIMGEMHRFSELVQFNQLFNKEFYENENPDIDSENIIYSGLNEKNIFQWNKSDQLVAMAQVMYEEHDYPIIGHVFTHPNFRGQGYASSLVHTITKGLIEHGHKKCCLMTNAYNSASNVTFQKVGYKLSGEYVIRYKQE